MAESDLSPLSVLGTLGLVALAIVGLSIGDAFLARTERSENSSEAKRLEAAGRDLAQKNRPAEAVEQFKGALSIDRENESYKQELGEAEFAAGKLADAEATFNELLRRNSTSGPTNLALARVLVKEGRISDAVSSYHRAIYGRWDHDAGTHETNARFELVNLLAQDGSKEDLLAELLPLLDVAPEDLAVRRRLGHLFLIAGSAPRADEIFRDILRRHPQDADAYEGLGEAEFARANYQTARADFLAAMNLKLSNKDIQAQVDLCNAVLALDPTRRGLNPQEQHTRSVKMLQMAVDSVTRCESPMSPLTQEAVDDAEKTMKARVTAAKVSDAVEANMNLAEQLWKIRLQRCKAGPAVDEEPLRLVIAKIAQ